MDCKLAELTDLLIGIIPLLLTEPVEPPTTLLLSEFEVLIPFKYGLLPLYAEPRDGPKFRISFLWLLSLLYAQPPPWFP